MALMLTARGVRAEQALDTASYQGAVDYCRGDVKRPVTLSADRKILWFDGPIIYPFDASQLEDGGLFVIRSSDGVGASALAISETLLQRHATVVIYDYCLSACATYIFFASVRTYVLKGALVAWQMGGTGFPGCPLSRIPHQHGFWTEIGEPCDPLPHGFRNRYDQYVLEGRRFYSERSYSARSGFPSTSPHIDRYVGSMLEKTGLFPSVAWTLYPAHLYRFKTKIHYEAYPVSQDEVDEIVARLQLRLQVRSVIHDP